MEQNSNHPYLMEYNDFLDLSTTKEVSGQEVGLVIAKLASYFANYNAKMVQADRLRAAVARDIENRKDDAGKPISSSKAASLADATDEAHFYREARSHVQNIEQLINALKAYQKGILNEYLHQTLT